MKHTNLRALCWLLILMAIAAIGYTRDGGPGWDAAVYRSAIEALHHGISPYAAGLEGLAAAQKSGKHYLGYPYSPITLPLIAAYGSLPLWLYGSLYWLLYAAGAVLQLWAVRAYVRAEEKNAVWLLAPAALLFPGLLYKDAILCGNIGYLLYGLIYAAAAVGWGSGRWRWFYLAVLAASCFKAPMLLLPAIAPFSARKQWLPAIGTGLAGLALFAAQAWLMPERFHEYLSFMHAVVSSFNHTYGGFSPAEVAGAVLKARGLPVGAASGFYLAYALLVLAALFLGRRLYFAGRIGFADWLPVMLLGVVLLNPRLKEYDVAPVTPAMGLLTWRALRFFTHSWKAALALCLLLLLVTNVWISLYDVADPLEAVLMLTLFAASAWMLHRQGATEEAQMAHVSAT